MGGGAYPVNPMSGYYQNGHLTSPLYAFVKRTIETRLLAYSGFQKAKNQDCVYKSACRYIAWTKNGHITTPCWPILVCQRKLNFMVLKKVPADTLLGPKVISSQVQFGNVLQGP